MPPYGYIIAIIIVIISLICYYYFNRHRRNATNAPPTTYDQNHIAKILDNMISNPASDTIQGVAPDAYNRVRTAANLIADRHMNMKCATRVGSFNELKKLIADGPLTYSHRDESIYHSQSDTDILLNYLNLLVQIANNDTYKTENDMATVLRLRLPVNAIKTDGDGNMIAAQ